MMNLSLLRKRASRLAFGAVLLAGLLLGANALPSAGAPTITRLNADLTPDTSVSWFQIHPDSQSVVFAVGTVTTTTGLYRVPIGGGAPTALQFTPALTTTRVDLLPVGISTAAQALIVTRYERSETFLPISAGLYRIPLDGGAPVALTPALGLEGSDPLDAALTPDGSRVVYLGRASGSAPSFVQGLFSTRVDGSAAAVRLSPDPGTNNTSISRFWLAPDGSRVAFAFPQASLVNELFSVPVEGPASAAVVLNRPPAPYTGGVNTETGLFGRCSPSCVQFTPDSQRVVFWFNPDLVSVPAAGPATAGITLTAPLTTSASINYVFSGDGGAVAYTLGDIIVNTPVVNGVPVTGPVSATVALSNQTVVFANRVPNLGGAGTRIIYQTGYDSPFPTMNRELWSVPFTGPVSAGSRLSLGSTTEFAVSPGGRWVLYSSSGFEPRDWYAVSTTGPALSRVLIGPPLGGGAVRGTLTRFTTDETRAVMALGRGDLYSVPLSQGLTAAENLILPDYAVQVNTTTGMRIAPDDQYVVYLAKARVQTSPEVWELFSARLPAPPAPTATPMPLQRIWLPALRK